MIEICSFNCSLWARRTWSRQTIIFIFVRGNNFFGEIFSFVIYFIPQHCTSRKYLRTNVTILFCSQMLPIYLNTQLPWTGQLFSYYSVIWTLGQVIWNRLDSRLNGSWLRDWFCCCKLKVTKLCQSSFPRVMQWITSQISGLFWHCLLAVRSDDSYMENLFCVRQCWGENYCCWG